MKKGTWKREIMETIGGTVMCGVFVVSFLLMVLNFYPYQ